MSNDKMIESFEFWAKLPDQHYLSLTKRSDGSYHDERTTVASLAWQAALAHQSINAELLQVANSAIAWIGDVPDDTSLPEMPEFDRDWADSVIALAQQASESVQFRFPRDPDPESPWVIDFDFLMKVRDLIEDVDFTPCLEDVEEVLRAVEDLYPALETESARLTKCLLAANSNSEKFEREWYLRCDEVEQLKLRVAELVGDRAQKETWIQSLVDSDFKIIAENSNLRMRVAELEFENSSIPEHQQIGKETAAERDALKLRVAELDSDKAKTKAKFLSAWTKFKLN